MKIRRFLALLCVLAVVPAAFPVWGQAGSAVFDEDSGESLDQLLREDDTAWPTIAPVSDAANLDVQAGGALLMDLDGGTVLYEKDSHKHLPIASVTKIMTLLLVMEAIDSGRLSWSENVTCSPTAASMGGSQIWLEPGEVMTVEQLVKAAAVVSANDACAMLAEHLCGTVSAFVAQMNQRAAELGMADTQFRDCSGLDDEAFSCAYDVALMSRELMKHPDIQQFTTIWMDTLRDGKSQLVNTNKMVRHYEGATGLKTGTTQKAGHCLAATATRNGTSFVAVVLGCDTTDHRFGGARAMLDYAFASFVSYIPPAEELKLEAIPVLHGDAETVGLRVDIPATVLLRKGTESQIQSSLELAEDLEAPVEEGQIVGSWNLKIGEETLCSCSVRTVSAVPRMTFRRAYNRLVAALLS